MVTVTAVIMLCVICTTCVVSNEPMRVAVNSKIDQRCTQDTTPVCSTIENALEKCAELLNNTSTDCWVELIEEDVGGHGFMSNERFSELLQIR